MSNDVESRLTPTARRILVRLRAADYAIGFTGRSKTVADALVTEGLARYDHRRAGYRAR